MKTRFLTGLLAVLAIGLSGAVNAEDIGPNIRAAVNNPARVAADKIRDVGRKPAQVLAFAGIEPGMTVLDVFSGSGYYSEMLNQIVGHEGVVIAHNNQGYLNFEGDQINARYADGRLPNVRQYISEANDLDVGEGAVDVALFILGYHDIFYTPEDPATWPPIDEATFAANIFRAVKPGGVLIVVDHTAPEGSASDSGNTLHRIRPEIVKAGLEAAGFTLEAEADFLKNPEDPLDLSPFEANIRGDTDRFVHRYRKPAM